MKAVQCAAIAASFVTCGALAQALEDQVVVAPPAAVQARGPATAAPAPAAASPLLPRAEAGLSATPSLSAPFARLQPQPAWHAYLRDASAPDRMPRDPSAFGRWVTDARLLAGIELTPYLALEGGYVNLVDRGTYFADYGRIDEAAGAMGVKGANTHAAVKLQVPVGERFEAYGKLGMAYSEFNHRDAKGRSVQETDAGPYVGAGARYRINGKASVSAGYEQYGDTANKWGTGNNNGLKAKLNVGF
ncbi:porin family protein [uncultured Massilia sp.]|uniref:porin family protein n=1 Tax=uncultured Massilia sp. TaxID=169973 RepID=UPI0025FE7725|nr:porin family protein [uncultured Massilia sp.]